MKCEQCGETLVHEDEQVDGVCRACERKLQAVALRCHGRGNERECERDHGKTIYTPGTKRNRQATGR